MSVKVDKEKCVGTGACVEACATDAIKVVDNKAVVDDDACIDCGLCVDACPSGALELE